MTLPSQRSQTKILGEAEGEIAESLVNGHTPSIASAILNIKSLQEAVITHLIQTLTNECNKLCQLTRGPSLFRTIPVMDLASVRWEAFIEELHTKAPTLLNILLTIVAVRDKKNTTKVGTSHYPGVCTAIAILLKERNMHMCGLQHLVSALMYNCHCEKQASAVTQK